jgi:CHRD domain
MKTLRFRLAAAVGVVVALAIAVVAIAAANGGHGIREKLTGYQEVPALSTTGHGKFRATIDRKQNEIHYVLTFGGLETAATPVAHPLREQDEHRADRRVPVLEPRQRLARYAGVSGERRHDQRDDPAGRRRCWSRCPGSRSRRVRRARPGHQGRRDVRERTLDRPPRRRDSRAARARRARQAPLRFPPTQSPGRAARPGLRPI